ncbi:hypothetical protein QLX67_09620 [Balneolaceae bacterium ANBcel3]|nr:hypothetical protein [Balneolaceae bacterium ANBcel3]
MKKNYTTLFLMMLFVSMFAFSCSSSNDNKNDNELIDTDLPIQDLMNESISHMYFGIEAYGGYYYREGLIFLLGLPEDVSLTINGNEVEFNFEMQFMQISMYGFEFDVEMGQNILYELNAGDRQYAGTVRLPGNMEAQFPETFDLTSNNTVSWTMSQDPMMNIVGIELDDYDNYVDEFFTLPGSARSYTFDRRLYSGFTNSEWGYVALDISALNYNIHQDLVVLASVSADHDYPINDEYYKEMPQKKSLFRRNIEAYQKAE